MPRVDTFRFRLIFLAVLVALLASPGQAASFDSDPPQEQASGGGDWIVELEPGWMSFSGGPQVTDVIGDARHSLEGRDGQTMLVSFDGSTSASSAVSRLWSHPGVAFVEPDIFFEFQEQFIPDDPGFPDQIWAEVVGLPSAWTVTAGAENVIVAVVDSGIRGDHPDLQGQLVQGRSWVGFDTEDYDPTNTTDIAGHGTAVAGIIAAAGNNGVGIAGTSMNVKLMPLRVGETTGAPVSRVALAVEYAVDHGASVINLSLGAEAQSARLEQALEHAVIHDVIVVAAAGNNPNQVSFPGSSPRTIAVGATTLDGSAMSDFSSRISATDLVAPGVDVVSTYWSAAHGNHYRAVTGTSFSTPIVAGVAAMIHSLDPALNVHDVRDLLQRTALMHFAEGTAGTGAGLLDANAAVREALLPAYGRVWLPADEPVAGFATARSWLWGPFAYDLRVEPYVEAEFGFRLVAYFDKSRMEITDVYGDRWSEWYVTNGLLVNELISGQLQVGDETFESREPAQIPVAGDPVENDGPTYESFNLLTSTSAVQQGQVITQTLALDGSVGSEAAFADYGVVAQEYIPETDHYVASVFWEYLNSTGLLRQPGMYVEGPIFNPTFFATGFPVSQAYWSRVTVGGIERDVLIQCFERRCLTYTPSNDPGWRVEMGNVGQHYYRWRYGLEPGDAVAQDPSAYALENLR